MRKLERAKKNEEVDPEILSLLDFINSLPDFYTTSSCSGRICLLHDDRRGITIGWVSGTDGLNLMRSLRH